MTDPAPTPTQGKAKSGSEKRERQKQVFFRVTDVERAEIEARAERAGLTVAGYLRAAVFGAATPQPRAARRPPVEKETLLRLLAELGKVGSNINQIARRLNQGKEFDAGPFAEFYARLEFVNTALLEALGKEPLKPKGELMDKLFKKGKAPR
jgi:hypothetical protein